MAGKKTRFIVSTPLAVASFPHLDKPDAYKAPGQKDDVKPKYKVKLMFDGDTDFSVVEAKVLEAIRSEWGEKIKPAIVKSCIKDGDKLNSEREDNGRAPIEQNAGKFIIDAASMFKPQTVDAKRKEIDARLIKGGDKVKAIIELIPCEPSGKKTIGVRLLAVQLVEKRSGEGSGWAAEFGEEEGFEAAEGEGFKDESSDETKPAKVEADDDF